MNTRWLSAVPALAALLCACLMGYLIYQIDETRRKLQSDGIVEFRFAQQTDHNFDRFAQALVDYRHASKSQDREEFQRRYIQRFDVLYSLFKHTSHRYAGALRLVDGATDYFLDANHFIERHEPFMDVSAELEGKMLSRIVDESREMSKRMYQLSLEMFEQKSKTRENITNRMDGLYDALWVCSIMFVITLSFALFLFIGLSRHAVQSSNAARRSQTRLDTALDELTSGDIVRKAQIRFVAAASHDLRQPLHALGLYLEAMKRHVVSEQGKAILENCFRSAEALNQLLNSMLDLSRLDAGVIEVNPEHLALKSVFSRLNQTFAPNARERDLNLTLDAHDTFVYCDPVLLHRVMTNLLGNALRYTEHGSVSVVAVAAHNIVSITVADTGIGIAHAEQVAIFDEYYQLHNPERDRTKGLGIGLSIVKRLTPLLDASLTLASTPGSGSEFVLSLPVGDRDLALSEIPESNKTTGNNLNGLSILVIDDESDVREGMETLLNQHDCFAVAQESADSALQYIVDNEWVPELVIADYRLRDDQTGDTAIQRIREELNQDVPAMIITGDTSSERLREAADSGIELLHKPLDANQLLAAITRLKGEGK